MSDKNTTTLDSLDASLRDLVKAADATATVERLSKAEGVNMEGGKGNNFASTSDAGKLDDMMIAKMTAAGFTPDQVGAMVAFAGEFFQHDRPSPKGKMKGKMKNEDEGDENPFGRADEDMDDEDEGDEDEDEGDEQPENFAKRRGKAGAGLAKSQAQSFREQFAADTDIGDAVDVSPFLEALTGRTTTALDGLHKSLRKSETRQENVNRSLAGALAQIGGLVKSLKLDNDDLRARLGIVERTPAPQKGVTGATALHKALPGEAGAGGKDELRKSEIVATLSYMNIEKGIRDIGGQKTSDLIVKAEAGNIADPRTVEAVKTFLRTHPMESETARRYA